jgi:predicted SAM-dependent methyltransferase
LREDNILTHSASEPYDAVLCRGVLNDLTETQDRASALEAFARLLRPAGILILDVREWGATVERKTKQPIVEKQVTTTRGALSFWSSARLDRTRQLLCISERHTLRSDRGENVSSYDFTMRCSTKDELSTNLLEGGFLPLEYFGGYDASCNVGATDRLVVVASRAISP